MNMLMLTSDKRLLTKLFDADIHIQLLHSMEAGSSEIKTEASSVLSGMVDACTMEQFHELLKRGLLESALCNLDVAYPSDLVDVSIDIIQRSLRLGERMVITDAIEVINPVAKRVLDTNGNTSLEELQNHKDTRIYHKINLLLDEFFVLEMKS